jgi:hypothetical protein
MSVIRFAKTLIAALSFCAAVFAQTPETPVVVYEDSTGYNGQFNLSADEYGDEVVLLGSSHYVTQFQFEYVGNFISTGDEKARIRFYENTGPPWNGASPDYATPAATPIWETVVPLNSGFNTATVTVPYVYVPLRFTWTVKFFGLGMTATENAGLLYYGKPIIGTSFNDFWDLEPQGWTVVRVAGITNNFAAKIMAVSAVPPPPSINVALSGGNLVVSWPPGLNNMWLENKPALGSGIWEPALPLPLRVGDVFQTTIPITEGNRIFRLNSQPQPPISVSQSAGGVRLRWSAAIGGQKIQSKASLSDATWTDLPTPTRPNGDFFETTIPTGSNAAFFRLSRAQ